MKINVLQLNWQMNPGGQDRHVIDLSNYLTSQGHSVTVGSQGGTWVPRLHCAHITLPFSKCYPYPLIKMLTASGMKGFLQVMGRLQDIIKKENINIIHCHGVPEVIFARWAQKQSVKLVLTHHGCAENDWHWCMRNVQNRCDHYIGVSNYISESFIKNGIDPLKVSTINYGIALTATNEEDEIQSRNIRQCLGKDQNTKIVVVVARLSYQKGIDVLLEAVPVILAALTNTVFVVVGGGPEQQTFDALIAKKGLSENIYLVGHQENTKPYLLAADLLCLPSRWEGLPLCIPEAYRAGLPVIATAVSGTPEIVQDQVNGWLVEPNSVQDLASKLIIALSEDAKRKCMAKVNYEYGYSKRFEPEFVHNQIKELYMQLL